MFKFFRTRKSYERAAEKRQREIEKKIHEETIKNPEKYVRKVPAFQPRRVFIENGKTYILL